MAKFKVLKQFKDKESGITHKVSKDGESIDITVKRGTEINKNLEKHGPIVERVEESQSDTVEE